MTSTPASLLDRLAKGSDSVAWERFVELYTPLLVAWCERLGLSVTDTADFTQDVFVTLVEQLPKFRYNPSLSFRAWLKTVLMNSWRKRYRKEGRINFQAGYDAEQLPDSDPGDLLSEKEHRARLVVRALQIMKTDFEPATWQACWDLVVHERPAQEVATELGLTLNSVYLAKSRVLRHLRTQLHEFLD